MISRITRAAKIYKSFSCSRRKKAPSAALKGQDDNSPGQARNERRPGKKGGVHYRFGYPGRRYACPGLLLYRPYRTSLGLAPLVHGRTMHITGGGPSASNVWQNGNPAVQCMCQAGGGRENSPADPIRAPFLLNVCHVSGISVKGLSVWKQNAGRTLVQTEIYHLSLARCTAKRGSPAGDACRTRWHIRDSLDSDEPLCGERSLHGRQQTLSIFFQGQSRRLP